MNRERGLYFAESQNPSSNRRYHRQAFISWQDPYSQRPLFVSDSALSSRPNCEFFFSRSYIRRCQRPASITAQSSAYKDRSGHFASCDFPSPPRFFPAAISVMEALRLLVPQWWNVRLSFLIFIPEPNTFDLASAPGVCLGDLPRHHAWSSELLCDSPSVVECASFNDPTYGSCLLNPFDQLPLYVAVLYLGATREHLSANNLYDTYLPGERPTVSCAGINTGEWTCSSEQYGPISQSTSRPHAERRMQLARKPVDGRCWHAICAICASQRHLRRNGYFVYAEPTEHQPGTLQAQGFQTRDEH